MNTHSGISNHNITVYLGGLPSSHVVWFLSVSLLKSLHFTIYYLFLSLPYETLQTVSAVHFVSFLTVKCQTVLIWLSKNRHLEAARAICTLCKTQSLFKHLNTSEYKMCTQRERDFFFLLTHIFYSTIKKKLSRLKH